VLHNTFLTSIPDVPSKTCHYLSPCFQQSCDISFYTCTTARLPGEACQHCNIKRLKARLLTSCLQNLTRALSAIGECQRHDFVEPWEFDLWQSRQLESGKQFFHMRRTLSKITRGPLIPPMVLYLILGVTDIILGSNVAAGAIVADTCRDERLWEGQWRRKVKSFKTSQLAACSKIRWWFNDKIGPRVEHGCPTKKHQAETKALESR